VFEPVFDLSYLCVAFVTVQCACAMYVRNICTCNTAFRQSRTQSTGVAVVFVRCFAVHHKTDALTIKTVEQNCVCFEEQLVYAKSQLWNVDITSVTVNSHRLVDIETSFDLV